MVQASLIITVMLVLIDGAGGDDLYHRFLLLERQKARIIRDMGGVGALCG